MLRNLVAALALASFAQAALGLGLGSLQKFSALNEPLSAQIEILSASATDFDTLTVKLADAEQFERAGILREAVLLGLKFQAVQARSGNDYIQVTSQYPIKEPYLNFLLEMNWANGRMVREYTVLLDPPLYDPLRKPATAKTSPAPFVPEPSPAVNEPIPAARPSPPPSPPPVAEYTPSPYSGGETIGPVQANDTLWKLANAYRPADVSVQQMMMALFLANPDAFGNNNINVLKRGAILRMPERGEIESLTQSEAIAQARQHHQAWSNYRQGAADNATEQPLGGNEVTSDGASDSFDDLSDDAAMSTDDSGRLELVAPEDADDSSGVGGGSGADSSLMQEQLDAKTQENAELLAKIAEADEIIDLMQRQVEIKDEELAGLQARLRELGLEDMEAATDQTAEIVDDSMDAETDLSDQASVTEDDAPVEEVVEEVMPEEEPQDEVVEETVEEPAEEQAPVQAAETMDDAEAPPTGFLSQYIPEHIQQMVPGGITTILGAIAGILLLLFGGIIKWLMGKRETDMPTPDHAKPKVLEPVDEVTEDIDDTVADDTVNELETETIEAEASNVSESFEDTLEATADELSPVEPENVAAEPEEDPLQEVNVYLAYERFDQAEELVRKVIAENPDEPKYRLQLLEVFYSANDQAAYEGEARNLLDAVGEDDPMWETALAMWSEISPDRALFAEGGIEPGAADTGTMKAFVDITADADDADIADITGGADTVSMGPDAKANLESTAVGLTNELEDDIGPVDFNLSEDDSSIEADGTVDLDLATASDADLLDLTSASEADDADVAETADMLDLTEAPEAADDDVFDLTATTDSPDGDAVLDLTATSGATDTDDDVFDLTAAAEDELEDITGDEIFDLTEIPDSAEEAIVDLTSGNEGLGLTDDDPLDLTTPSEVGESDLLDVTKTGDLSGAATDDLLNVTSPGMADNEPSTEENTVDFDISETVADVFSDTANDSTASDELLDITGGDDDQALDFEIGSLEADDDDDLTVEFEGSSDSVGEAADELQTVKLGAADDGPSGDDTVDFDLSLQSSELDELTETTDDAPEEDAAIDFDLALEDTSDMDSIVIDETLELPKASIEEESLEDLTKSMEDSMAELELDMGSSDEDLESVLDEDMDLDVGEFDIDGEDTIGIEAGSGISEGELDDVEQTVVLPEGIEAESAEGDEIDTKLNLAKAYIELGDNDGAKLILDEVSNDGTDEQKTEAQRLIDQIS